MFVDDWMVFWGVEEEIEEEETEEAEEEEEEVDILFCPEKCIKYKGYPENISQNSLVIIQFPP